MLFLRLLVFSSGSRNPEQPRDDVLVVGGGRGAGRVFEQGFAVGRRFLRANREVNRIEADALKGVLQRLERLAAEARAGVVERRQDAPERETVSEQAIHLLH